MIRVPSKPARNRFCLNSSIPCFVVLFLNYLFETGFVSHLIFHSPLPPSILVVLPSLRLLVLASHCPLSVLHPDIRANFIILLASSAQVSSLFCFILIRALAGSQMLHIGADSFTGDICVVVQMFSDPLSYEQHTDVTRLKKKKRWNRSHRNT